MKSRRTVAIAVAVLAMFLNQAGCGYNDIQAGEE